MAPGQWWRMTRTRPCSSERAHAVRRLQHSERWRRLPSAELRTRCRTRHEATGVRGSIRTIDLRRGATADEPPVPSYDLWSASSPPHLVLAPNGQRSSRGSFCLHAAAVSLARRKRHRPTRAARCRTRGRAFRIACRRARRVRPHQVDVLTVTHDRYNRPLHLTVTYDRYAWPLQVGEAARWQAVTNPHSTPSG